MVIFYSYSSSKLPKFRKCTYTMNPSYSRPVSLDPLFSQPVSLCVTCFTPVKWLVAMGRPFQLNLEIVWHHVDALCCSWNAMEPGWAKACPDKWVSHFGDWRRRGFQNIVWLVCWVGWNPVKLQQLASARSVEFGKLWPRIPLSGDFRPRILMSHRTRGVSSHHREPHRTPHTYSQIIVLHKRDRTPEKLAQTAKNIFFKKLTWRVFFIFFSLFGGKMLWNLIIWNMGEIVVFPAFWAVAHTIAFHEILILLTCGGYGNSRLLS